MLSIRVRSKAVAPSTVTLRESTAVCHVLAVRELAVDVDWVPLRVEDAVVAVLLEEATLKALEALGRVLCQRR